MGIQLVDHVFEPERSGNQDKNQDGISNRDGQYFHAAYGYENQKPFNPP